MVQLTVLLNWNARVQLTSKKRETANRLVCIFGQRLDDRRKTETLHTLGCIIKALAHSRKRLQRCTLRKLRSLAATYSLGDFLKDRHIIYGARRVFRILSIQLNQSEPIVPVVLRKTLRQAVYKWYLVTEAMIKS